jgi:hypothetical protein
MKNVINEHLPAIWEMPHNRSVYSLFVSRRESLKSTEHIMLDMAHDYGYCHIALIRKGVEYINVFSELPDYILVKSREFKKDLERIIVKDINGLQVPFAVYTAVDGNIKEGSSFIWLKRSQVRPTRVLTIKY